MTQGMAVLVSLVRHFGHNWNISTIIGRISMKFWTNIRSLKRMKLTDFGDPLTEFYLSSNLLIIFWLNTCKTKTNNQTNTPNLTQYLFVLFSVVTDQKKSFFFTHSFTTLVYPGHNASGHSLVRWWRIFLSGLTTQRHKRQFWQTSLGRKHPDNSCWIPSVIVLSLNSVYTQK